jgi:hypothetical protein
VPALERRDSIHRALTVGAPAAQPRGPGIAARRRRTDGRHPDSVTEPAPKGVSPKLVLVIAGVWVGDVFSGTQRGGVGSDRAFDAAGGGAVSSVA